MNEELQQYLYVVERMRLGQDITEDELKFFYEYTPEIDQAKIKALVDAGQFADSDLARNAIIEAGKAAQTSPVYKSKTLEIAKATQAGKLADKLSKGINLVLAGTDIANSIAQIKASNSALKKSQRPGRPAIPQRDQLLAQALGQAQEGSLDATRALAPAQAQIQDQYLADMAAAKTASTGQAGAYGAYAQLAANRRNRSAQDLIPIADQVRAREQARFDDLVGMRMDETQRMFNNANDLYGQDLYQYNLDQQAAGSLGSTGRSNLRNSLYNLGAQIAPAAADYYTKRKYDALRNNMMAYGEENANAAVDAERQLERYLNISKYDPNQYAINDTTNPMFYE